MKYKNKKTKAIINTNCVIKGGDWELVNEKSKGKKSQKTEESQNEESQNDESQNDEDKGEE